MRVMLTVLVIPIWFRVFHGYAPNGTVFLGHMADVPVADGLILVVSGIAGYFLARWVRLPLPFLTGPMIVSAIVHALGWTAALPPAELVAVAQIVFGASIGCRFAGMALRRIVKVMMISSAMTLAMLLFAFAFAFAVHEVTGLPFSALLLAYSPGGVAEMNLITVALQIDPAFVATHHIIRIGFLLLVGPFLMRFLVRQATVGTAKEAAQQGE
jgi:membrane AbrB-like protein